MLSSRLYKIIGFSLDFGSFLGCASQHMDKSTLVVYHDSKLMWKLRWVAGVLIVWNIFRIGIMREFRRDGNTNAYNVSMAYFLGAQTGFVAFGIQIFYPHDVTTIINGMITFFRYLSRKSSISILITVYISFFRFTIY